MNKRVDIRREGERIITRGGRERRGLRGGLNGGRKGSP